MIYRIYEFTELLEEFDPAKPRAGGMPAESSSQSQESQGSQGKGSGESFRPSPIGTTLRPPGMPQNWRKDEEEDKDKGKK